jgi:hypothetical protein
MRHGLSPDERAWKKTSGVDVCIIALIVSDIDTGLAGIGGAFAWAARRVLASAGRQNAQRLSALGDQ